MNGRWQLAFWIISTICGVWLAGLTNGVIANDRLRITKDEEIIRLIYETSTQINASIAQISGDIREIKVKVKDL